ncbi:hypothetical protein WJX73_010212 [Symbiochloris irregularis]|uniref:DET1- and DDB1-associated protein 1 domain-containing protein n=1 Tax=Symbiochloris irregularis TaxID=706552 RepID=A0AAW1NWM1_9CHLO
MLCDRRGLLDLPSHNPSNFSRCSNLVASRQGPAESPRTYIPTHSTLPPPHQVIQTESQNILLRQFYQLGIHRDSEAMECSQTGGSKRTAEAAQEHSLKRRRADTQPEVTQSA